ncbi:MAG: hypothetical protein A3B07_02745 [Candidatus Yonathbacteria bacterium RIFCSPLOWO2_01_FULL_43_27]|uniref:RelA/SpoT domain-containing protein n=1 Tax=Candidatus Yonathbacteria bacterium RIFCSPLOWO2_01_FULL_43_27 TaxID=1802726 RepID=A0A1G2SBV9_9BACT|nr:MAG: hypothetical protein A3B07_02745 [Candidatus Yonathbacteria bacterium RIFCSPLOWO2_01_FULL_43_27]
MPTEDISLYRHHIGCDINTLVAEVYDLVKDVTKCPQVSSRVKDLETLRKKMVLKNTHDIFSIDDVYGIRIIVTSIDEVYAVLERISRVFEGFLDHDYFKNAKACPSVDGKFLRLVQFVAYKNKVPFEVQVTTASCHETNESLHARYHRRKYGS